MGSTQEESAACLIAPHPQRRLDQQNASFSAASVHEWRAADDHKPFHVAWLPQRQLWTLVGMVIQTRVAHTQELLVGWLPPVSLHNLLVALLLLLLAIVPQTALAAARISSSFDCIAENCTALSYWDGGNCKLTFRNGLSGQQSAGGLPSLPVNNT
jgi:hypothetical protein